ncbi:uncharacterized protein [Macrobrachium rosenbergii]|uniref:uncharacterized protein isoform X2 n=1 Tax=Macrobrachium rosenbergii TaxID=79674 RepID=UPI0034D5C4E6
MPTPASADQLDRMIFYLYFKEMTQRQKLVQDMQSLLPVCLGIMLVSLLVAVAVCICRKKHNGKTTTTEACIATKFAGPLPIPGQIEVHGRI